MDISVFMPYIISIVITLGYASLGKLSSGEPFDVKKFAETLGVQVAAMVAVGFAGYPELTALVPSLVTVLVMKAYAYLQKKRAGEI